MADRAYNLDLLDRSDYGGFWQRTLALYIDSFILYLPILVLAVLLGAWVRGDFQWSQGFGIQFTTTFIGWAVYSVYFWTGPRRATPGKRIVGLVVATDDGFTLDGGKSLWRVVALFISASILIGPLLALTSERRQTLHDLLAGTVVIKVKAAERVRVQDLASNP